MSTDTSLNIFAGNDANITVTVKDSDGNPIDITGYKFWFTAKKQQTDADSAAVISKIVTDLSSPSDPTNGIVVISLTKSDTNIAINSYSYDIQMKDTSGNINTITKGFLAIKQRITQASQ